MENPNAQPLPANVLLDILDGIRITTTYDKTLSPEEILQTENAIKHLSMLGVKEVASFLNALLETIEKGQKILGSAQLAREDCLHPLTTRQKQLILHQVERYKWYSASEQ